MGGKDRGWRGKGGREQAPPGPPSRIKGVLLLRDGEGEGTGGEWWGGSAGASKGIPGDAKCVTEILGGQK